MNKLGELISKIILGSSLLLAPSKADITPTNESLQDVAKDKVSNDVTATQTIGNFQPKLVLKHATISSDGVSFAQHRSHSSHASHGSHGSHASHYLSSGGTYIPPSPPAGKIEPRPPAKSEAPPSPRVLVKGMNGSDVFELEKLLLAKGYKITPDSLFDDYVELVVKDFQAKAGIQADGKVGPLTLYHLKK